jgi:Brp/Blh family beta-carotene 15,15'-monooxygenase
MTPESWLFFALGAFAVAVLAVDTSVLPDDALVMVLAVAVAVTGLPHGALDPWVAWRAGLWQRRRGLVAFHLAYVGIVAVVVATWRLAPGPSLAVFLAISAWHFAGDWRQDLPGWSRAVAGLAMLALPAWRRPGGVDGIFGLLAGADGSMIAVWLHVAAPWLALGMAITALVALRRSPIITFELAGVALLAVLLPPLMYFIVYFCALHSVRHLRTAFLDADPPSRPRMAAVAVLYTVLTLVAAVLAWPWLVAAGGPAPTPSADLLRLVFIGLAGLTLPHMLVVMLCEETRDAPRYATTTWTPPGPTGRARPAPPENGSPGNCARRW